MEDNSKEEKWSVVISHKRKLLNINAREIIRYRDLIYAFVRRDFITQHKQTILGPIWYMVSPVFSAIVYSFVFGNLANIGTDGIPHILFYYSGIILWGFFSGSFGMASGIFFGNAGIWGKVYFPRLITPISSIISMSIKTFIQVGLLTGFFIYYRSIGISLYPSWLVLLFPLLFFWLGAVGVGMGFLLSSVTTKYRDIGIVVGYFMGLAMFAAPVVYPLSEIPQWLLWVAYINPVTAPIELFRQWAFGFSSVTPTMILTNFGITVAFLFSGLIVFNQAEATFIDVI